MSSITRRARRTGSSRLRKVAICSSVRCRRFMPLESSPSRSRRPSPVSSVALSDTDVCGFDATRSSSSCRLSFVGASSSGFSLFGAEPVWLE